MNRYLAAILLALSIPMTGSAQMLSEDEGFEWKTERTGSVEKIYDTEPPSSFASDTPRTGMCLAGTSGLISVPTPDFQTNRKGGFSLKTGVTKRDIIVDNIKYDLEKNEHWMSAACSLQPNLEISVNHLRYERSSAPTIGILNYSEESTGFGMKYSTHVASQDLCLGGMFAPMSAVQINKADLVQIEHLRSVYLTLGEKLSEKLRGYLNLKHCFTDEQDIVFPSGRKLHYDKKEFLASAIALDYAPQKNVSIMLESQFLNYRDFYNDSGDRVSLNVGVRGGSDAVQAELFVTSFNVEPDVRFGLNFGF